MKLLSLLLISLVLLTGCGAAPAAFEQISQQEAAQLMVSDKDHIILDVRTPEEYASGYIPEAINIPNETIGSGSIPLLPRKDQLILIYCRSGNRSKQAARKLVEMGYTNIKEFWTGELVKP